MSVKDSITMAAVMTLALKVGATEAAIVAEFDKFLNSNGFKTTVNQPTQITVKKRDGTFARKPLIGGEGVTIVGAYLGKRDGVVLQFQEGGSLIEMPAKTAENVVDRYELFLTEFINTYGLEDDTSGMIAARSEADLLEQQAHQEAMLAVRKQDVRFGSW